MNSTRQIESLTFETTALDHVVAGRDFEPYTLGVESTIYATVHLWADDDELTHGNHLPARVDILDTLRAQYELVKAIETDGSYDGEPFCCTCGNRGCAYIRWAITERDDSGCRIEMTDVGGQPIGNTPYEIDRDALYSAIAALVQRVVEFCERHEREAFEWAPRLEPPIAGREQYATVSELNRWHAEIRDLVAFQP